MYLVPFVFLVVNVPPCFCVLRVSVKSIDVLYYVCSHRDDIRHTQKKTYISILYQPTHTCVSNQLMFYVCSHRDDIRRTKSIYQYTISAYPQVRVNQLNQCFILCLFTLSNIRFFLKSIY